MRTAWPLLLLMNACKASSELEIQVDEELSPVFERFVEGLADERVSVVDHQPRGDIGIEVILDDRCGECYQLDGQAGRYTVTAGGVLGAQYGVAAVLEAMGYRFWHPYDPYSPATFALPQLAGESWEPPMKRRGIHLHTLHPIEGLQAFWVDEATGEPGSESAQIIDWVIKNRGNHLQWVGLDDISEGNPEAWQARTKKAVDLAHQRGLTVGLGVQLFGSSNLQRAFDLVDDPGNGEELQIAARLSDAVTGIDWDVLNLSFGEFSGAEPEAFVASVNLAYAGMQEAIPGVDVPATIHVGNYEDLRVEYQGQEMLYYFLVQFADPGIKPWIHSVMYYNLFEDAGGAYLHDEFDEHRDFLLKYLEADKPVGYFPETAYWVAFDNPVPQYLPLYVRSRWIDLEKIGPKLDDQVLFSSGWEWGYWQGDVAALRQSAGLYGGWEDFFVDAFSPLGDAGAQASDAAIALTEVQHQYLIEKRLSAYMAGRDAVIDIGDGQGILSQPDRPSFDEVQAMSEEERALFSTEVVDELLTFATAIEAIVPPSSSGLTGAGARVIDEVSEGLAVDMYRARFIGTLYQAVVTNDASLIPQAEAMLEDARGFVQARHSNFHDPQGSRWTAQSWDNPTIYDYGYLARSDQLCFWEREAAQVRVFFGGEETVPACF